jgi:hypothetical protein
MLHVIKVPVLDNVALSLRNCFSVLLNFKKNAQIYGGSIKCGFTRKLGSNFAFSKILNVFEELQTWVVYG